MKQLGVAIIVVAIWVCLPVQTPFAQSSLVWQTTFNCNDWSQSMGLSDAAVCVSGDGIGGYGAWHSPGHPNGDEITAAANNPAGAGGKGFRHWRADGVNSGGGGIMVSLPSAMPELWVRWYMRYQLGFAWTGGGPQYTKELYFNALDGGPPQHAVGFKYSTMFGTTTFYPSRNIDGAPGWTTINGGPTGDGRFHCYEVHMKTDTNRANGVFEAWVDGVRATVATDVDWGTARFTYFVVGENQNAPSNGGDRYTDYDDFAVSATGYIGPIGGAPPPTPLPAAPTNLHVVR